MLAKKSKGRDLGYNGAMAADPETETASDLLSTRRQRLTLGFLTANIHLGAARSVWIGVVDAAQHYDADLFCFPGGGLGIETQRNEIYTLAHSGRLDGLVSWSSALGGNLTPDELVAFHRHYAPLPIVTLGQPIAGISTVMIDSCQGMRALVGHLIRVHGCRRLAFIRGPESHYYAQERFHTYLDTLRECGIPADDALITPPTHWEAGAEAVRILLDERRLRPRRDFDAVIAVSDLLAIEALRTFLARGIRVPGDVAVVGFNDSQEGQLTLPPLTSAALPFYEQGYRAVEVLLEQVRGRTTPSVETLHAQPVIRQSCGCPSQSLEMAHVAPVPESRPTRNLSARQDKIRHEITRHLPQVHLPDRLLADLLAALDAERRDTDHASFLPVLENALRQSVSNGEEVAWWSPLLSILRRAALPYWESSKRQPVEDTFEQARVLIEEAIQKVAAGKQWQAGQQSATLHAIGQAVVATFDVEKLVAVLAERLPEIGIRSGYLAVYEKADPTLARLFPACAETLHENLSPEVIPPEEIIPRRLLPGNRPRRFVVEPLYVEQESIGFIAFEIGPREGMVYEMLRGIISSALKGAALFRTALDNQAAAEKANHIKTRLLANVSHEMRTPLHIILGYTHHALSSPEAYERRMPPALLRDLEHIQHSAEHQLRIIDDLLDLSRAEIDELYLDLERIAPRPLLEEAFYSMAERAANAEDVTWWLRLPDYLPPVQADAVRLRQILLNLLSNALKFTARGSISLGAEVAAARLHIWVSDTGIGIPADQQEHIFEPFITAGDGQRRQHGVGLGLSITRRLVALHRGEMALDSAPGRGSVFHVYLPLAEPDEAEIALGQPQPAMLLISASECPADAIVALSEQRGMGIRHMLAGEAPSAAGLPTPWAALAWDVSNAQPEDGIKVYELHQHPRLKRAPLTVYGQGATGDAGVTGLTNFVIKPANEQTLQDIIKAAAAPANSAHKPSGAQMRQDSDGVGAPPGPVLIVDDDPRARELYRTLVAQCLPGYPAQEAEDGAAAMALLEQEIPCVVILDLVMPGVDGFDVLDRMRAEPRTRSVPVVILSGKQLTLADIKRLEGHAQVILHSKGILSAAECSAALHRALFGDATLPPQTGALAKRAVAYIHQNYARPLARWEIATAAGVSEDYLSRIFRRELGLSPWNYLNRYRIEQAKPRLQHTQDAIKVIARQVGFKDQLYFSRIFRKVTGQSPSEYRKRGQGTG
ncbi:MAG: substrate-binding domain-containing protein [Anaerolineae bacterium]|nr:substrate-binding domain-containing protein [Anaerolineae bacterium]